MADYYGAQNEHGVLKRVLMHRPGEELERITPQTASHFGFTEPVDIPRFLTDFDHLVANLTNLGTEVILLTDVLKDEPDALNYISQRPNMTYTRDLAVVMNAGALLMSMYQKGRKGDPWVIGLAMNKLGIPVIGEIRPPGFVEGGGIMFLSERQMIVSLCDRTTEPAIFQMCDLFLGELVDEIIMVPVAEGNVHIDGLLMFISPNLAVAYRPDLELYPATIYRKHQTPEYVRLTDYIEKHGFEILEVDSDERNRACVNYVAVEPLTVIGYDWSTRINHEISRRGGISFGIPADELAKGNAGPHCMTCPILKQ